MPKIVLMKHVVLVIFVFIILAFTIGGCKKKESGDGIKPIIIMIGYSPMYWALDLPYVDMGAEAYDISAAGDTTNITASVVVENNVDVSKEGNYKVTYNVADDSGLAADEQERIVKVVFGK